VNVSFTYVDWFSSEKARIPAWTDRILRKGVNLRQLSYNSAPLRFSDHRPVYATFECVVSIVDEKHRDKISQEIYERRKAEVGGDTANLATDESEDEDLIGYDAIEPGLPPASSDRQKWWLENGRMPRSSLSPPKPESPAFQTIMNPKRPSNPYVPTDEPDWVNIPRSESRLSSFSSMSTSPYEHVNHSMLLSASVSSSAPRKLPPPFDASDKVGRLHIGEDLRHFQTDGPPPPPPRRQTSSGTSTSATTRPIPIRKPANRVTPAPAPPARSMTGASQPIHQPIQRQKVPPPVSKKPAHLTAPGSPVSSSSMSSFSDNRALASRNIAPAIIQQLPSPAAQVPMTKFNGTSNGNHGGREDVVPPLKLPRRSDSSITAAASGRSTPAGAISLVGLADQGRKAPQLPRRSDTNITTNASGRSTPAGAISLLGLADQERKPPQLPNRKPVAPAQKPHPKPPMPRTSQTTVDLLGDDNSGMEMGGWEALKPT